MKKQLLFAICAFFLCTNVFAQAKLHILRDFMGGSIFGISSNGKYATGGIEETVGFRYDIKNETWIAFAHENTPSGAGTGYGVSNNGLVIGIGSDSTFRPVLQSGFIWTDDSAYTFLGVRPGANPAPVVGSLAYGVTADAKYIVGSTPVLLSELSHGNPAVYNIACVWNNNPGKLTIDPLAENNPYGMGSRAESISDNGKVIAGHISTNTAEEIAIWINRKSPIMLGFDDLKDVRGYGMNVSPNARFVTGYYETGVSFLWDAFHQDTILRIDSPATAYMANGVSSGGTIVGFQCGFQAPEIPINNPYDRVGMIKLPGQAPQELEVFLEAKGIYASDESVRLTTPIRISNDGRIIGGFGWDDVNNAIVPFIVDLGEALDKGDLTPFDPPMDTTISNENIHTQMEKISIYPNPAQEVLNISGDYNQVRIFDLRGREVFYSATPCKTISLNQFKRGMYFVKFNGNTGSQTSKLIIQ